MLTGVTIGNRKMALESALSYKFPELFSVRYYYQFTRTNSVLLHWTHISFHLYIYRCGGEYDVIYRIRLHAST